MVELLVLPVKENRLFKGIFDVSGILITLVVYGVLQEKIMRVPNGLNKEYFKHSLFLVFCNRLATLEVSVASLVASKKALDPLAPVYKYCMVSVTNILTTTCQFEVPNWLNYDFPSGVKAKGNRLWGGGPWHGQAKR